MYMSEDSSLDTTIDNDQLSKWNDLSVAIPQYSNHGESFEYSGHSVSKEMLLSPSMIQSSVSHDDEGCGTGCDLVSDDEIRSLSELFTQNIVQTPLRQQYQKYQRQQNPTNSHLPNKENMNQDNIVDATKQTYHGGVLQSKMFSFDENAVKGVLFGSTETKLPEFNDQSVYDHLDDGVNSAYIVKDNTGQKWVLKTLQDDSAVRELNAEEQRRLSKNVATKQCQASLGNSTNSITNSNKKQTNDNSSSSNELQPHTPCTNTTMNNTVNEDLNVFINQFLSDNSNTETNQSNTSSTSSNFNIEVVSSPLLPARQAPIHQLPKISNLSLLDNDSKYDSKYDDDDDDMLLHDDDCNSSHHALKNITTTTLLNHNHSTCSTTSPILDHIINIPPLPHIPSEHLNMPSHHNLNTNSIMTALSTGTSSIASIPTLYGGLDDEDELDLGAPLHGPSGVVVGHNVEREIAAKLLDHQQLARVPTTLGVVVMNNANQQLTVASLQRFQSNIGTIEDYGPSMIDEQQLQNVAVLDLRLLSLDRHSGNILVTKPVQPGHQKGLVPIDHSYILPSITSISCNFTWLGMPHVKKPVLDEVKQYIQDLSILGDAYVQKQCGIAYDSILSNVLATGLLKKLVLKYNLSLHDIGSLFVKQERHNQSTIDVMVDHAIQSASETLKKVDTLIPAVAMSIYLKEFFGYIDQQIEQHVLQITNK